MNGHEFQLDELPERDRRVVVPDRLRRGHRGTCRWTPTVSTRWRWTSRLYIPYIVTDHGVLLIEEHGRRTMTAVRNG